MSIAPGPHLLSDVIISSPILSADGGHGEDGEASGVQGASSNDFEFGVDPSLDPELAMVSARTFDYHFLARTYKLSIGSSHVNARRTSSEGCGGRGARACGGK